MDHSGPSTQYIIAEVGSGLAVIASWMGTALAYLPVVLSLIVTMLAMTWYVILIYESRTFRDYLDRGKHQDRALSAAENMRENVEHLLKTPPPGDLP